MKKIIGIFVVLIVAIGTLYIGEKNPNNNDVSLSGLMAMNIANAELNAKGCRYTGNYYNYCQKFGYRITGCVNSTSTTCSI